MLLLLLHTTMPGATCCCHPPRACSPSGGVLDNVCHQQFIECLDKVAKTGKKGFSKKVMMGRW